MLLLVGAAVYFFNIYFPYSEGNRSGELVKFSRKGVIFKTWEGEMSQGVSEAQRFFFSVEKDNQEVIDKLNDMDQTFVKLKYEERYFTLPWISETNYIITNVEQANRGEEHDSD